MQDYPSQIDCAWLASDADGRLAAMITAGSGPIPEEVLSSCIDVTEIEGLMFGLAVVCEAIMHVKIPRPDSFIELGKRGLFVYDWTDVHRTSGHVAENVTCCPGTVITVTPSGGA